MTADVGSHLGLRIWNFASKKPSNDSNAKKHIKNTLAVVRKWREEHKR
jgi:hypothetical protein